MNGKRNYWLIFKTPCKQMASYHTIVLLIFLSEAHFNFFLVFFFWLFSPNEWGATWPLNVKIPLNGITVNSGAMHHMWMANIHRMMHSQAYEFILLFLSPPHPHKNKFSTIYCYFRKGVGREYTGRLIDISQPALPAKGLSLQAVSCGWISVLRLRSLKNSNWNQRQLSY